MDESADTLLAKVIATAEEHDMLPVGGAVLAMLSGGGDSVALLHMLATTELGEGRTVSALHVDHMLRGAESDADRRFCEELCASLDVELAVERVDVAARADAESLNIEDAGRVVRYELATVALAQLCARNDVPLESGRIAVAHTRDDRVETTLMRLAQGAGAAGLTSLRPVRGSIVRPLFECPREEVRTYLEASGISWREDATNEDADRLRAKVRAELVPVFRDINPRFDESLVRSLDILTDEDDLLAEMAEAFVDDWIDVSEGAIAFDRTMLATLSRPMLRRTLRIALARTFPSLSRLEFDHIEALADGVGVDGFSHDLPGDVRAHDEYGKMVISGSGGEPSPLAPQLLTVPGELDLGDAGTIHAVEVPVVSVAGIRGSVIVDADKIEGDLEVGSTREGERMQPLGMEGTKKLSDLLVDEKVPRRLRTLTPVVRDAAGVVWLAGVRMSETHKVDDATKRAIEIRWVPAGAEEGSRSDER